MGNKFVPIGIVIIALVTVFLVRPNFIKIRSQSAELKAINRQITQATDNKKVLEGLQQQLGSVQQQINDLKLAMPAAQQIPEVMVMMEAIAAKSGIKITGIEVQPNSSEANEVGVTLSGEGTYPGLFTFTSVLERNVRPIQIRSLSIGRSGKGETITASVSLGVIYQGSVKEQVGT